ncbi:MAG: glutathione S-transferase family protein [Proteobacteria bacterium]|nr:glutathione S-transferase family protein [Pseudomonadota bacterium]
MLELYDFPNSICAQKVRMTLLEKGLDCKKHDVNLFKSAQYDPEYLKLNPKGYVPTLVHDGKAIRESNLICEYLNEMFPDPPLAPSDPAERAHMRLWGKAVDEGLFEGAAVLSFSAMFRERMKQQTEEQRQQRYRNVGDPARRDRYKSTYEEGVESPYVFRGIAAFEIAFKGMDEALAGGADWLVGDMFSLAEINLAPMVARLEYLTLLDPFLAGRPAVRAWWRRVQDRPSYRDEITNGISPAEVEEMRAFGVKIRDRVGERREEYLEAFG